MLSLLAPQLWELYAPLSVLGMALGHRMTVARLGDGSLWIHSPVEHSAELARELAALGPVRHVVAPNCVHDTYLEGWFAAYPQARFHGAPGFKHARPDLRFTDKLGEHAAPAWAAEFDQLVVRGMPRLNEVVFLHRASKTLIVTDLVFNLGREMSFLSSVLLRINGCYDCFAASRLLRTTIRDRAAVRDSIDRMLAWDFDRLVLSHGRNVDTRAKEQLREAFLFV